MAFTDITSVLDGTITGTTIAGAGTIKLQKGICSPYGFEVSAYQGTYLASDNLNINSSCASMRLTFTKTGTTGVNIKLRYMVQSEKNYDYGMFGRSGVTLTSGATYSDGTIYSHTRTYEYTTPQILDYYLPSSSYIDILYKKDGSTHTGWDRLFVAVMAEAASGGGGDTGGTTSYYWAGGRFIPRGYVNSLSSSYILPSSVRTGLTVKLVDSLVPGESTGATMINSGTNAVCWWISGSTDSTVGIIGVGNLTNTQLPINVYGVATGHRNATPVTVYMTVKTGTTAASVRTATGTTSTSIPNVYLQQNYILVSVYGKQDTTKPKAYFTVTFDTPINETYLTGKNGKILIESSAITNGSVHIEASRNGSETVTSNALANSSVNFYPTSATDKVVTYGDLAQNFDTDLTQSEFSIAVSNFSRCVKYDSSRFDSRFGATNKLMCIHDFLSFTGTSDYFKNDEDSSLPDPTPVTGYTVTSQQLTVNYIADGSGTFTMSSMLIDSRGLETATVNAIYTSRTLTAGTVGSFNLSLQPGNPFSNVIRLIIRIVSSSSANANATLNTSQGGYFVSLTQAAGEYSGTITLTDDVTLTSMDLVVHIG